ncbi:MAG: OsmC family protein [Lewinellaceae bacterium]|nr:OsmC family protein [Lewinellaceae bacterium]
MKAHKYYLDLNWVGNTGTGTSTYNAYQRDFILSFQNKPDILGSSDSIFLGDQKKHNPEDLFLASIATCHMLWYLHLCADHKIVVLQYSDHPEGVLTLKKDGSGRFTEVTLHPKVVISDDSDVDKATSLHHLASQYCFIANSLNFEVQYLPMTLVHGH